MKALDTQTPVLVLGGAENSLSVARSLGRQGIAAFVSASSDRAATSYSRFSVDFPGLTVSGSDIDHWRRLLLENPADELQGAVVMAMSDVAIAFIREHDRELRQRYLLERNDVEIRAGLLDKLETLRLAERAGLNAPKAFSICSGQDIRTILPDVNFPVLVKPIYSHLFRDVFGVKLFVANTPDETIEIVSRSHEHGLDVMLCEWIPGPNSLLRSYYTYIDGSGRRITEFTKFVTRRWPQFGGGAFHGCSWQPDVAEAGRKFVDSIGMKGIFNIEFKRDTRDNSLKVIESNPRITAAQELLLRSGVDFSEIIYRDLTGQELVVSDGDSHQYGLTYWYPRRDFAAFRASRRAGEIGWGQWIHQVSRRHVFPYFQFSDPMPTLVRTYRLFRNKIKKILT